MSINDIIQKKRLFQKIGLGTPQSKPVTMISQSQTPSNPPKTAPTTNPPATPPSPQTNPTPKQPAKPGCGGCRRKRS
jgi:hypothetical protein